MQDSKQIYLFYLQGMPKSIGTTLVRTIIVTSIFALLELAEEYFFGQSFNEAIRSSYSFIVNVFPKLFVLFFLMTVIPRLKSQYDFLKKSKFENKTGKEIYIQWLAKN
jgi:hypothetical protein